MIQHAVITSRCKQSGGFLSTLFCILRQLLLVLCCWPFCFVIPDCLTEELKESRQPYPCLQCGLYR